MAKVKVRVAVAVDGNGDWIACGSTWRDDETAMGDALDSLGGHTPAQYFLTTELDIPEAREVEAEVENGEG